MHYSISPHGGPVIAAVDTSADRVGLPGVVPRALRLAPEAAPLPEVQIILAHHTAQLRIVWT